MSNDTSTTQVTYTGRPPRFEGAEKEYLAKALASNNLFYWQPEGFTHKMLQRANQEIGGKYAVAASSGTAAIHVGVGTVGIEPGDEVVSAPITDMGSLIGILYQNAIPVFADVDPRTYNMTAESIEKVLTDRTRAVMLVHLAGNPADLDPIVQLCKERNIALIEDCAQSYGCYYKGQHVGTFGEVGCFSLNDFKHLGTGDGGFTITSDETLYYQAHNYADKFYDRHGKGVRLSTLAPNYRISELQSAVGLAQFDRMKFIVETRRQMGDRLTQTISDLPGVLPHKVTEGGTCSYWFYMFRIDEAQLGMSRDDFSQRLNDLGIPAGAGYIPRPIYQEPVFQEKSFFPGGVWPAELVAGKTYDYRQTQCPNAEKVLQTAIRLPLHEGWTEAHVDAAAAAIRTVVSEARG